MEGGNISADFRFLFGSAAFFHQISAAETKKKSQFSAPHPPTREEEGEGEEGGSRHRSRRAEVELVSRSREVATSINSGSMIPCPSVTVRLRIAVHGTSSVSSPTSIERERDSSFL